MHGDGPTQGLGAKGTRGAHVEHEAHVCDVGGVPQPPAGSNAPCILFVAIVNLQCSHPVLHSKTSINTSRPIFPVYMRFKPLPGEECLQSVFAICNCNRTILARTSPWGEVPAECICNLQLQSDDLGSNLSAGEKCLQSVFAICNCNRTILARTPPWGECLQSVFAICNCNRTILRWLEPLPLGRNACRVYLQSAIATEHLQLGSRASAIAAEHLQLQPSICNWAAEHLQLQPNICNCSRTSDLQLQPSICNCN